MCVYVCARACVCVCVMEGERVKDCVCVCVVYTNTHMYRRAHTLIQDPNVKPACKCTGGRKTQFTNTEEGGPLDTGGHGAWPQDLPMNGGAAYIDGIVGNNAYKAKTQTLAWTAVVSHEEALQAYRNLLRLAGRAVGGKAPLRIALLGEEAAGDGDADENSADNADVHTETEAVGDGNVDEDNVDDADGHEKTETVGDSDDDEDTVDEDTVDEDTVDSADTNEEQKTEGGGDVDEDNADGADGVEEKETEGDGDADEHEETAVREEARWRLLHTDPKATASDRNLIEQLRRNYQSFLADSGKCDQLGDYCEGRLCRW